ncbi:MAG: hypothetical protein ACYC8W_08190 [Candidatus Tyrphobacter sp.]
MIRASCSAALLATALCIVPCTARATLEADPRVLYQQMKAAYAKAQANGWDYFDQLSYLSTIFNAGRAYSLQRPDDPAYGELATLTVQIGAALHYDPLTNHDAATWYVREASVWVMNHVNDPDLVQSAQTLLERVDAEDGDHPAALARFADEDADALAQQFPHEVQADVLPLEADWRGWELTHDPAWRSKALARAAQPAFPIANLPDSYAGAFVDAARAAIANVPGYTADDRANAAIAVERLRRLGKLEIIAHLSVMPHDVYMTTLAPADEYFGPLRMSVLGIENEMKHVNFMLDYRYGNRESGAALEVARSVDDMHRVYPRDRDMTKLLYACIRMLGRMSTPAVEEEARHLRGVLTVEYQDSPQAQALLGDAPP